MKIKTVLDANGRPYEAYVAYTKKGSEVHVDKALADLIGKVDEMIAAEVLAHEAAGL